LLLIGLKYDFFLIQSSRITAYMLWAKEQRETFSKKYPNMDMGTISKKLSDLWATVPQNQKKLWKTRAMKLMRKSNDSADNLKNSAIGLLNEHGVMKKKRGRPPADRPLEKTGQIVNTKKKAGRKPNMLKQQIAMMQSQHQARVMASPKNRTLMGLKLNQTNGMAHLNSSTKHSPNNLFGGNHLASPNAQLASKRSSGVAIETFMQQRK